MPKPFFVPRPTGLFCRFLVPVDLRLHVGSKFVVRALHTSDKDQARLFAAILAIALKQMFERLRQGNDVDVKKVLENLDPAKLKKWEAEEAVDLPNGSISFKGLKVTDDADQARLNSFTASLAQSIATNHAASAPIQPIKADKGGMLLDRIEQFLIEKTAGELSEKNIADFRIALLRFLIPLSGNKPLNEVDSDDADLLMQTFLQWPANAAKKTDFKGLSIQEVIEKNKILKHPVLEPRSIEKYIDRLRTFFNWADGRNYLAGKNPFAEFRIMTKDKRGAVQKQPFDNADLMRLFDPVLREKLCSDEPHKFWMPLLALYSGARINELAQPYLDDITQIGNVWVFRIHASRSDMRIKNPSSERTIPIHQTLLDLGFLDYIEDVRRHGFARLFPTLPYSEINGYGDAVGDWFNRSYLRPAARPKPGVKRKTPLLRADIADTSKTFHSFRYVVCNRLYGLTSKELLVAEITGHARGTSALAQVYLTEHEVETKKALIDQMAFPFLTHTPYRQGQFQGFFLKFIRTKKAKKLTS